MRPRDRIREIEVEAIGDRGSVLSVVPIHVVERLGLEFIGRRVAVFADGRKEVVEVTEPLVFDILDRSTMDEAMVVGDEVLIGQTVLEKLDLLADCARQRLIPNPDHPEQPVAKIRRKR